MKYISLHVAIHHPFVTINQSLKGTLGISIGGILCVSGIDLQLKNVIGTGTGQVSGHEDEKGLLDIQILAIVAIVEKATVLAETSIWLNAINHYAGLNYNLGVNATIGLCDKGCIRCQ